VPATRVGIFYHCDPAGHIPSGIDSFIRGILQWAPPGLEYYLYGASADPVARPVGREATVQLAGRDIRFLPLISVDAQAARRVIPFTVQYIRALRRRIVAGGLRDLDILDFHRAEPALAFGRDPRPRNVILHQDMSVIRDMHSDIKWRHFPWLYEFMERRVFGGMDRVFCVRESAVERYTARYPDLATKFTFIPTWVDTGVFHPASSAAAAAEVRATLRARLGLSSATQVLVFVGRLDRQKDPLLLLQAFRQTVARGADLHLVLVGDGALRSQVEGASGDLQGRVTLCGALARTEIAAALQAADLFVLSSAYEGMPIAVLEALATGLPVVSTDVGEVKRVVTNGVNGFLAADRSAGALAAAIDEGLKLREQMKGGPCERSVLPFHPDRVLNRIYDNHRRQAQALRR
jgi:glycosyltransferase involved in cell wall biosynthesis